MNITKENKDWKRKFIAKLRYDEEIGGFTLPNGMFIRTDMRTRLVLTMGKVNAMSDDTYNIQNWKLGDGTFIDLDSTTIIYIAQAVETFITDLFTKEAQLGILIDSAITLEDFEAINW